MTTVTSLSDNGRTASRARTHVALAALLGAGLLLGISTNLAKIANGTGVAPLAYLTWSLAGASLLLTVFTWLRGQLPAVNRRSIEYFLVSGFLSSAASNLIFFHAVARMGVSFVALMLAMPPLLTYVGALALRMERFCWWRAAGVMSALIGSAVLVTRQWSSPDADVTWILLTLIGPVLLAAGNLYRTRRWPPGARPESLAPGMLLAAMTILFVAALATGSSLDVRAPTGDIVPLIAVQAGVFAGQFLLMFVLQRAGGPVFLSLLGSVGAVFGVPIAMILLAEPALPALLPSAALIAGGIAVMLLGANLCRGIRREPS